MIALTKSVIDLQKESKGIQLLVGRGTNQRIMKILPILTNMNCDNLECLQLQALNGNYLCPRSCRFCGMESALFYKYKICQLCLQHPSIGLLSKGKIIDTVVATELTTFPYRNGVQESILRQKTEEIWWKTVLFDKSKMRRGEKILKLSTNEKRLLHQATESNIKFIYNPIPSHIFGFFNRWNTRPLSFPNECSNLLIFPLDKLHSFGKGNMELCFRFTSIIIYLYGKTAPDQYRNNLHIIDNRINSFNIYQPSGTSPWGKKIERRLPGLSSKF